MLGRKLFLCVWTLKDHLNVGINVVLQISAPISALSESSSDAEDSETDLIANQGVTDFLNMEKFFLTGILDELKICFNYNHQVGKLQFVYGIIILHLFYLT